MKALTKEQAGYLVFIINAYGDGVRTATMVNILTFKMSYVKPLIQRAIKQTGNQHYKDLLALFESAKKAA